jgi:hypothetical protein
VRSLTGTVRLVTALVAGAVVLAGCSSASGSGGSEPSASPSATTSATVPVDVPGLPARIDYVALGDSFTAGPLLAPYAEGGSACLRSAGNYPSLLAERLDVASFTDVSCSGATVGDLFRDQRSFTGGRIAPPQLAALTADTDLVTVGIGGNDENLFGSLAGACMGGGARAGCTPLFATDGVLETKVASARRVESTLVRALAAIHRRAPDAVVVVVGYPDLLPSAGRCAAAPFAAADYRPISQVEAALNGSLRAAARAQDATYVDLAGASRGHDICAGKGAWVNGAQMKPGRAAAYHPYARGMRGAADAVLGALAGQD